jgi:hypothetical protein
MRSGSLVLLLLMVAGVSSACSEDEPDAAPATPSSSSTTSKSPTGTPSPTATPSASDKPVVSTPKLDSMVVLGHSGTTGAESVPGSPEPDTRSNSWATGTNPKVNSIYRRLVATHPALKGHSISLGVDGSPADALFAQVDAMLQRDPVPDLVIIQTIDNDIRCDGTDPATEKAFGKTLDEVLDKIYANDRYAQVFFVDQWASVQTYTDFIKDDPSLVANNSGTGPCDAFTEQGRARPQAMAYLQNIVNGYFAQILRVCAAHRSCYTDKGHMQDLPLREGDLTPSGNHLTVQGLRTMAAYAWAALPAAIKNRK